MRDLPDRPWGEVVVGVGDSPACRPALAYAFEQARLRGGALWALHAWQVPMHAFAPEITCDMDEIRTARRELVAGLLGGLRGEYPDVKVR